MLNRLLWDDQLLLKGILKYWEDAFKFEGIEYWVFGEDQSEYHGTRNELEWTNWKCWNKWH
jgi:hypothetical protein